ncbi:MAG: hypothetical protein QOI15_1110, partial [Pseudonocardiales bacterium]|nr:hypothetical protein [Pseudonocardiales bacterium]
DALAWCVRLVSEHTDEWLSGLREAMENVANLRAEGPNLAKEYPVLASRAAIRRRGGKTVSAAAPAPERRPR